MKKNKFEIFTTTENKAIPKNMVLIKDNEGWLFLQNEGTQWYINHTNTFNSKSKEDDTTVIKAIIKQVKINKAVIDEK